MSTYLRTCTHHVFRSVYISWSCSWLLELGLEYFGSFVVVIVEVVYYSHFVVAFLLFDHLGHSFVRWNHRFTGNLFLCQLTWGRLSGSFHSKRNCHLGHLSCYRVVHLDHQVISSCLEIIHSFDTEHSSRQEQAALWSKVLQPFWVLRHHVQSGTFL